MKQIILIAFILMVALNMTAQVTVDKFDHRITYKDKKYMKQHFGHEDIWFLKDNIPDGKWIVFYDSSTMRDTAMTATVLDGLLQGQMKIYDREHQYVSSDWKYDKGMKHGTCFDYVYFYFYAAEGADLYPGDSIYIEIYKMEYDYMMVTHEEVLHESIKYKTTGYNKK